MRSITVGKNDAGQRIDKFMCKFFPAMPQSLLYKSIRKNCVKINRKKAKEGTMLQEGDVIDFYIHEEFFAPPAHDQDFLKVTPDIDVVYEDQHLLIVNKKAGMVVHDDESDTPNTLIAHIQSYLYKKGEYNPDDEQTFSPALCNRIDKNTSGMVIAAKTAEALRIMNRLIKERQITKKYLCVVCGVPKKKSAELKGYLIKDERKKEVTVSPTPSRGAKSIVTRYRTLAAGDTISLLEVDLQTGRTHQIRAHMASIGHPLLGDGKYGINKINKAFGYKYQALCAYCLKFDFTGDAECLNGLKGLELKLKSIDFLKLFDYKMD